MYNAPRPASCGKSAVPVGELVEELIATVGDKAAK
jgi:hypothetical protein